MWRFGRSVLAVLVLSFAACSAVVDFPPFSKEIDETNELDAATEYSGTRDSGVADARRPSGTDAGSDAGHPGDAGPATDSGTPDTGTRDPGRADAAAACQLNTHVGCAANQLCCDRGDGRGPTCFAVQSDECTACGVACGDPAAPNCGPGRRCECEAGSGFACATRAQCIGAGVQAHCMVEFSCTVGGTPGMNGCTSPRPFCQSAGGAFSCRACTAGDCTGTTRFCATQAGAHQGDCVGCRTNADCTAATAPVCDANTAACRARQASDCASGTVFDPASQTCVDCVRDADCADTPATPLCVSGACVQCTSDAQCTSAAPMCDTATHTCSATCSSDAVCASRAGTPVCIMQGSRAGQCGVCDPADNGGCAEALPFCFSINNNAPVCHECNPDDDVTSCPDGNCRRMGAVYRCANSGNRG